MVWGRGVPRSHGPRPQRPGRHGGNPHLAVATVGTVGRAAAGWDRRLPTQDRMGRVGRLCPPTAAPGCWQACADCAAPSTSTHSATAHSRLEAQHGIQSVIWEPRTESWLRYVWACWGHHLALRTLMLVAQWRWRVGVRRCSIPVQTLISPVEVARRARRAIDSS